MSRIKKAANIINDYRETGNLSLIFSEDTKMRREIYKQLGSKNVVHVAGFIGDDFMVFRTRVFVLNRNEALASSGEHIVYTGKSLRGFPLWASAEEENVIVAYLTSK